MLPHSLLLAGALALATPSAYAFAQDPAAAAEAPAAAVPALPACLANLHKVFDKPFECDLNLDMNVDGTAGKGSGHLAFLSPRQFHFQFHYSAAGGEEGEGGGAGDVKIVADDAFVYVEIDAAEAGATQAFKVSVDLFQQLVKNPGMMMGGMAPEGVEPDAMKDFLHKLQFSEAKLDGDVTRISTTLTEVMGEPLDAPLSLSLDVDGQSGFPKQFNADAGADGKVTVSATGLKFPGEFAADRFKYAVPEGVAVMDLTPILQMQLGAAAGADDEF